MKNIIKFLLSLAIVVSFNSCSDSNKTIDDVFDYEVGAVLRTLQVISGTFDPFDLSSEWRVSLEEQDVEDGDLFQGLEVWVSFRDITPDNGDSSVENPIFVKAISASDFTDGPHGLPRGEVALTLNEALTALSLSQEEITLTDIIVIELKLLLTDGRIFGASSAASIITGGFFASPFQYNAPLVCLVDADYFIGTYLLEQISGTEPFFGSETFGGNQIVEVTADGISRIFLFNYWNGTFDLADSEAKLDLICNEIFILGTPSSGVSCGGDAISFATGNEITTYDGINDDVFVFQINDFVPDGDCGTGPVPIVIRLTKQ